MIYAIVFMAGRRRLPTRPQEVPMTHEASEPLRAVLARVLRLLESEPERVDLYDLRRLSDGRFLGESPLTKGECAQLREKLDGSSVEEHRRMATQFR